MTAAGQPWQKRANSLSTGGGSWGRPGGGPPAGPFRYRIVDPDKAAVFMNRKAKPVLVDQANGQRLPVPTTAKVGRLRSTNSKPQKGRQYFMLFANPGTYLQSGSKVTLEMGDLKFTDLTIE